MYFVKDNKFALRPAVMSQSSQPGVSAVMANQERRARRRSADLDSVLQIMLEGRLECHPSRMPPTHRAIRVIFQQMEYQLGIVVDGPFEAWLQESQDLFVEIIATEAKRGRPRGKRQHIPTDQREGDAVEIAELSGEGEPPPEILCEQCAILATKIEEAQTANLILDAAADDLAVECQFYKANSNMLQERLGALELKCQGIEVERDILKARLREFLQGASTTDSADNRRQ